MVTMNIDRIMKRSDYKDKDTLRVTSFFRTIQGEGPYAGYPAVFLRLAGCNFGDKDDHCQFCFPEDTTIQTLSGKVKFKDVKVGDKLLALDDDGKITTTTVQKVLTRSVPKSEIVNLTFDVDGNERSLMCTSEHPVHTSNRGFVPAGKILPTDKVVHVNAGEMASYVRSNRLKQNNPSYDANTIAKSRATFSARKLAGEYDLSRTPEQKENYRQSKLGDKNPMKRHDVRLKSALGHSYPKSSLETSFEKLFADLGVNVSYTGNSGFAVGDDTEGYRIPDFKLKGKKLIEIYHTGFKYVTGGVRRKRTKKNYEDATRKFYEKFGYEVLFLTEKDLPSNGVGSGNTATQESLRKLKEKVVSFRRNGAKLIKRTEGLTSSAGRYADADGQVKVVNFSCAPYNTFLVNDIHTHNCDTSFQYDNGKDYTIPEIMGALTQLAGYRSTDVLVITGGEPLLQEKLLDLFVYNDTHQDFKQIQVETNGTQSYFFSRYYDTKKPNGPSVSFVVSPKASKRLGGYARLSGVVMGSASCLKFVVSSDPKDPQHKIPDWASEHKCVYVSPMAVYKRPYAGEVSSIWDDDLIDREATKANYAYAAEYTMKHGLLLSLQTHLFTAVP